jgi:lysophospholipase L1-like esterase
MVVAAAVLAMAVLATWLLLEPAPLQRVYDPFAHRIPQPGLVERFRITNDEDEWVSFQLNELGMRGPAVSEPPTIDDLTLVFLGGSTTENYRFNDEDTFPVLVGRALAGRSGQRVHVFNAGMSGGTTAHSLGRLQHQVLDLQPDLIVVQHAINDLLSGFHPGYRKDQRHLPRAEVSRTGRRNVLSWLRRVRASSDFTTSVPYGAVQSPVLVERTRSVLDYDDFPALAVFRRNLLSMAAVAAAHDIPILFLTQASMYAADMPAAEKARRFVMIRSLPDVGAIPPDVESLARGMDAFNGVTRNLPRSSLVSVHDLAHRIELTTELFFDDCHLTSEGNRRVAGLVSPIVADIVLGAGASD